MNMSRSLLAALIRAVAIAVLAVALLRWLNLPGDDDGLGTGLVAFLIMIVFALVWGLVDGFRVGFLAAFATWLVAGLLGGLATVLVANAINGEGLADDLWGSGLFFAFLVGIPAFFGFAVGGIAHLFRRKEPVVTAQSVS